MKILYITNAIHGSGGLERVLSVKASYLAENFGYNIHILTLNSRHKKPFYNFNPSIKFHDVEVGGNPINYFLKYKKGIQNVLKNLNPDVISVCDDGLKGLLFPIFFGKKIPIIYERHVSKQIEYRANNMSLVEKLKLKFKFSLMDFGGKRFHKFVVLTEGNLKEWNFKNLMVISNPLPFETLEKSKLINKKIIVVGKQSYQKGYDRLLKIWKLVHEKFPNWKLEIYGKLDSTLGLEKICENLNFKNSVSFLPPVKNIQDKYMEASIYLMTSRFEGFGMVLIEAMSYGVPCISFDCPHGPGDIINNGKDGFLVTNGDLKEFVDKLVLLMEDTVLRKSMGMVAKENVNRFNVESVMSQWDDLFQSLKKGI